MGMRERMLGKWVWETGRWVCIKGCLVNGYGEDMWICMREYLVKGYGED
jgi:hypothetical protein